MLTAVVSAQGGPAPGIHGPPAHCSRSPSVFSTTDREIPFLEVFLRFFQIFSRLPYSKKVNDVFTLLLGRTKRSWRRTERGQKGERIDSDREKKIKESKKEGRLERRNKGRNRWKESRKKKDVVLEFSEMHLESARHLALASGRSQADLSVPSSRATSGRTRVSWPFQTASRAPTWYIAATEAGEIKWQNSSE